MKAVSKTKTHSGDNIKGPSLFRILVFAIPLTIFIVMLTIGISAEGSQQFADLSQAFLHGQTNFLHSIGGQGQDPVFYNGKIYWDEGPFPSITLMPFMAVFDLFHIFFYQGYIKWAFVLATTYFIFRLSRQLGYSVRESWLWIFGFTLGSVYIGVNSVSSGWLYAQVVNTALMFWVLYEYRKPKKNWWLIGVITSMIFLTRIPAAAIALVFLLDILYTKASVRQKIYNIAKIGVCLCITATLIALYNYQRFGDPFSNGNKYQLLSPESSQARSLGLFSPVHIPTNLYTFLLRGPNIVTRTSTSWTLKFPYIQNNELGMSTILISPYLLYFFLVSWKKYPREVKFLLFAAALGAITVFSYFGDGADQFGYRYSLDFLPEIFLALMILYKQERKRITGGMEFLLLASGVFDFLMVLSYIK